MSTFQDQLENMKSAKGFIAALDQSGGSTPKALMGYGVEESAYSSEEEMFKVVHDMRTRIIVNQAFDERIIGCILFQGTMERDINGKPTSEYLWEDKQVVPFLKIDKGMEDEADGVQLLKPMPDLEKVLQQAKSLSVFGTKMRSVIKQANQLGIKAIVDQQFEIGKQIINAGLVPIIEPEVDINISDKAEAEVILKGELLNHLDQLGDNEYVILKLTLPEEVNFYKECIEHPKVVRVVALSGGYSQDEANHRLEQNHNLIASFSRALLQDLRFNQTEEEFTKALDNSIETIYQASIT
jgi:fructose-bisphosphate aldolase class I